MRVVNNVVERRVAIMKEYNKWQTNSVYNVIHKTV